MPGYLCITHPFATLHKCEAFDLHVLGTPPAFILSQDQTLHCLLFLSDNLLVCLALFYFLFISKLSLTLCFILSCSVFNVLSLDSLCFFFLFLTCFCLVFNVPCPLSRVLIYNIISFSLLQAFFSSFFIFLLSFSSLYKKRLNLSKFF